MFNLFSVAACKADLQTVVQVSHYCHTKTVLEITLGVRPKLLPDKAPTPPPLVQLQRTQPILQPVTPHLCPLLTIFAFCAPLQMPATARHTPAPVQRRSNHKTHIGFPEFESVRQQQSRTMPMVLSIHLRTPFDVLLKVWRTYHLSV
eukprot:1643066-Amphidinium_carterae.1